MKQQRCISRAIALVCILIGNPSPNTSFSKEIIRPVNATSSNLTQVYERVVEQGRPLPKDPVELTEVKVQGKVVRVFRNHFSKTVTGSKRQLLP